MTNSSDLKMAQVSRGPMLPSSNTEQNKPYEAAASCVTHIHKTYGTTLPLDGILFRNG